MAEYKMLIDLSSCVGCGACAIACKSGNNTEMRASGQTHNWADFLTQTIGAFPSTKWQAVPVRCNHCDDPLCVEACPVEKDSNGRKAMYKDDETKLVLHDDDRCIGCRRCQRACPYSVVDVGAYKAQWSSISYNVDTPHAFWSGTKAMVLDGTSTPADVVAAAGMTTPPCKSKWEFDDGSRPKIYDVRRKGIVEKCYFCAHRLLASPDALLPYCVQACPANARKVITDGTLKDDDGTSYSGDSDKTLLEVPADASVLAHGSMKRPAFTAKPVSGYSRPNMYFRGSFSKR